MSESEWFPVGLCSGKQNHFNFSHTFIHNLFVITTTQLDLGFESPQSVGVCDIYIYITALQRKREEV